MGGGAGVLIDARARARFRDEWQNNFAVSANAGSGKTTAISERLAAMALSPDAARLLARTAVVTYTKKAAGQIGRRARAMLLKKLGEAGAADFAPLDHLERAFFGTIHSFCLLLARRHGQAAGINLNPSVVGEDDEVCWESFLDQDAMRFDAMPPACVRAFLRHVRMEDIFDLARRLAPGEARLFLARAPRTPPPGPDAAALDAILAARSRGKLTPKIEANQRAAAEWLRRFRERGGAGGIENPKSQIPNPQKIPNPENPNFKRNGAGGEMNAPGGSGDASPRPQNAGGGPEAGVCSEISDADGAGGVDFLPIIEPDGDAGGMRELFRKFFAPLKTWLADAGAALAAELAERYREWRFDQGIQTHADQIDAVMVVLRQPRMLEEIRAEGWRIILDEAQDTDPQQFAVLVEITRAPGARLGAWPAAASSGAAPAGAQPAAAANPGAGAAGAAAAGGEGRGAPEAGPRPGHFCMVGDGQQAIYGSRADIRNFLRHVAAFARGDGGELLKFEVTFRTPSGVVAWLNRGFPHAFGAELPHNAGLPPAPGAPAPVLQVGYQPLAAGPANAAGRAGRLPLAPPAEPPASVGGWLAEEARQVAAFFKAHGPAALGARNWGEVCVLAPRNDWLLVIAKAFEAGGLKAAVQIRRNRNGDNPVYAWMAGLLAAVCDPDNAFEWFGVLREVFAVSDRLLVAEKRAHGGFRWDEPEAHPEPLRGALAALRPFVLGADDEGVPLGRFAAELARACALAEKARALGAGGSLEGGLERLLAEAATLGLAGAGPREWRAKLLAEIDGERPSGGAESDAINLLSSHSAKGLEWPVVVPAGFWRGIGRPPEPGMRIVPDAARGALVFFDSASMPADLRESRHREQLRELTRLLYVTLTRPSAHLVIPWHADFGRGARKTGMSFADLWDNNALLDELPALDGSAAAARATDAAAADAAEEDAAAADAVAAGDADAAKGAAKGVAKNAAENTNAIPLSDGADGTDGADGADETNEADTAAKSAESAAPAATTTATAPAPLPALPRRLLPHQLAHKPDLTRTALHDAPEADFPPASWADEAIAYGIWWHGVLEMWPWGANDGATPDAYAARALRLAAAQGFAARAAEELARFRASRAARELGGARWRREAELPFFAPQDESAWLDGVIDLLLHDAATGDVWVVDWKTNRRRPGESDAALLARLAGEYTPQLRAYGRCARLFFPRGRMRLLVYSSAAGEWADIAPDGGD
ncbi:MAG: UvrD-helicase domain-containing protein [Opitutaceae bacterium]|nr:UvrD-helicase domain-containing protein [Opitutaceae bacterium]